MLQTKSQRQDDFDALQEGKPFIRGILAFLIYITRAPIPEGENYYSVADSFIRNLEGELRSDIAKRK